MWLEGEEEGGFATRAQECKTPTPEAVTTNGCGHFNRQSSKIQDFFQGGCFAPLRGLLLADNPLEKNLEFFRDEVSASCVALGRVLGVIFPGVAPRLRSAQVRALRGARLG